MIIMHVLSSIASILNNIPKLNFPTFKMLFSLVAFFFTIIVMLHASMLITADISTANISLPEFI